MREGSSTLGEYMSLYFHVFLFVCVFSRLFIFAGVGLLHAARRVPRRLGRIINAAQLSHVQTVVLQVRRPPGKYNPILHMYNIHEIHPSARILTLINYTITRVFGMVYFVVHHARNMCNAFILLLEW